MLLSQKNIVTTPKMVPISMIVILESLLASGNKSKQIIDSIRPDANDKIKLKILFEILFTDIPSSPPRSVPIDPKNNPFIVVLKIKIKTPLLNVYLEL